MSSFCGTRGTQPAGDGGDSIGIGCIEIQFRLDFRSIDHVGVEYVHLVELGRIVWRMLERTRDFGNRRGQIE